MSDQNKKTLRQFQCRDYLWEIFEQMSGELECSVDYLINEAMRQYARSRNYAGRPGGPEPSHPIATPVGAVGRVEQPTPAARPGIPSQPAIPSAPPPPAARSSYAGGHASPAPIPQGLGPAAHAHGHGGAYPPPPSRSSSGGYPAPPAAPGYPSPAAAPAHPVAPPPLSPGYPAPPVPAAAYGQAGVPRASSYPPPPPTARPPALGGAASAPAYVAPAPPPLPGSPGAARPPGMPTLYVIFNGQKYPVTKEEFIIGRGTKTADLAIKDGNISRRHAAVVYQNGAFYMKDLGSTNGIEFQGRKVDGKRIEEGDVYQLCDYELRFTFR